MRRAFLLLAGVALVLAQAGSTPALGGEGRVNAAVYAEVPAGSAVSVRPRDDTDENLQLQDAIERALEALGYRIAANAPLVMTFWTSGSYDLARRTGQRPGLLQFGGEGGNRTSTDLEAQVTLFSSKGGGLFQNPANRRAQKALGSTRHRLDAVLSDPRNGRRVWQGQSYTDVSGGDPLAVSEAMVPVLVDSFAKTVRQRLFTID